MLPLGSLANRVFEVGLERDENPSIVVKFYRPGRWSRAAIVDEHRFLGELEAAEVSVAAPLPLKAAVVSDVATLGQWHEYSFALLPRVRGRLLSELDDQQLKQAGRLLARLHQVGAAGDAPHRRRLTAEGWGLESLGDLERVVSPPSWERYRRVVRAIVEVVAPRLAGVPTLRLHGDCHPGNVLWESAGPRLVDFDDMVVGPAIQDVWMIVRGRGAEAERERDVLVTGYQEMRDFDESWLDLIEPLRALRMIHYAAWIARHYDDPSFAGAFPDFLGGAHWAEEVRTLEEQWELMTDFSRS